MKNIRPRFNCTTFCCKQKLPNDSLFTSSSSLATGLCIFYLCCSDFCIGSLTKVLHSALQMISNGRCTLQSNYNVEFKKQMYVIILPTYLLHASIPGVALKSCVYAWIKIFFYLTAVSVLTEVSSNNEIEITLFTLILGQPIMARGSLKAGCIFLKLLNIQL